VTLGAGRIVETLNGRCHRPPFVANHRSVGVSLYPRDGAIWSNCSSIGHGDVSGKGSRPKQRADVQPCHDRKLKHRVAVEASYAKRFD